jgi:steroid 5-alpha reductase family enzyme
VIARRLRRLDIVDTMWGGVFVVMKTVMRVFTQQYRI